MSGHRAAPVWIVASALLAVLAVAPTASAVMPPGYRDDPVVGSLSVPRDLAFLPSGDVLVIENEGLVKVVESGVAREVLDLTADVKVSGEQGLLGLAIDPDFPSRPYVYFHYTAEESPGHVRLSRFTFVNASGPGPLAIDAGSELIFIDDIPDNAFNHNGGTVRFGPDKRLYMSIGEDADPCGAQNLSVLKGKILRVNVDSSADPAVRSTLVPSDNPFANQSNANAALVFAYGLRNPFRLDIDPSTGVLYIGDVGQSAWEEIDVANGGENFGWPYWEGFHEIRNRSTSPCAGDTAQPLTLPIFEYPNGGGSAIIFCAVYRGVDYPNDASFPPEYEGALFFQDFYAGNLRALHYNASSAAWEFMGGVNATNWATGLAGVPSMRIGSDGALYYVNAYTGALRRIVHLPAPTIGSSPVLPVGTVGVPYAFDFEATGGETPYAWNISAGSAPPGLSLDPAAGSLAGTPNANGTFAFTVNVTGNGGPTSRLDVTMTVRDPLVLASATLPQAYEGEPLQLNLSAGGGLAPYAWEVTAGALPPGIGLQGSTGLLGGTPESPGLFSFTVRVSDPEGRNASTDFALDVLAALQVTSDSLPGAEVFVNYTASVAGAGGLGPYNWSLSNGVLPGGLNMSSDGTIAGTPLDSGLFPLTLRVEDANARVATRMLDLVVAPPAGAPPFVSVSFAPEGTAGQDYSWNLTAAGGYPPFVWSLVSGALPQGLTLSGTGAVTGQTSETGDFTFTVRVTDSVNQTANATFTVHIEALPHSVSILPIGDVFAAAGSPMSPVETQWVGENVVAPLVWQATGLPSGLTVAANGTISGTPLDVGVFTVNLTLRDSGTAPATANATFTIRVPRVDVVPRTLPTLEVDTAASQLLVLPDSFYSVNYTISSGSLPPGLSLTAAGALVGTPTQAGNFTFTMRATGPGPANNFDEETFTIRVNPSSHPPPATTGGLPVPLELLLLVVLVGAVLAFVITRRRVRRDRPK